MPNDGVIGLLHALRIAVVVLDDAGRVRWANPAFCRAFKTPESALRQRTLSQISLGWADPKLQALLARLLRRGIGFSEFESEFEFPGVGRRVLRLNACRLDSHSAAVVIEDLTARRAGERAEAERGRENMQRQFIANVSHELRTPVAAILGFAETLRQGGLEDKRNRLRFLQGIERHAQRLTRLVDDLLELAARQKRGLPPRPTAIALRPFVEDALSGLLPLARKKRLAVRSSVPAGLEVSADPKQLAHILQNLLENAIDYNKTGGRIILTATPKAGQVQISVRDTGIGLTKQDIARIFARFERTQRARAVKPSGTGLGLAIVRQIVESHGGKAWAEGRPGKGASFHVTLPRPRR